jgi:UDP-glucose 4-epimerase
MKVVVFGGAGFLGSHVCDKLTDAGHDVTVFDIVKSPWLRPEQQMIVSSALDSARVREAVDGAGAVFNFAGIADIGEASDRPVETVEQNILTNAIILNACVEASVDRYVFASSVYVYSKTGGFYRCSKQACELYIESFNEVYGLDYTILRYGSLYGPRANEKNAIYRFVKQALQEGRIVYFGGPEALREYIHVEDAALASVEIMKPQYANSSILLTGNQPMVVENLFRMIAEILGRPVEFVFEKDPKNFHYQNTPYSFSPKLGKKLSPGLQIDLGQGILSVIEDVHRELNPKTVSINGLLVEEE